MTVADWREMRDAYDRNRRVLSRPERFKRGMITVDDLDDEEIQRQQVREDDGTFARRKPRDVPRELVDEMQRRLLGRGGEMMQQNFFVALQAISEIAGDVNNPPNVRLQAAKMIIDRVDPKPAVLQLKPADPVQSLFQRLLGDPENMVVINGTVADEDQRSLTQGED